MTGLRCMNCKTEVAQAEAKFFAEVFLCPQCHSCAVHFYARMERELSYLLVVAKEAIRVALVTGKFSFSEPAGAEPSKTAVLKEIIRMVDAKDEGKTPPA